jgi:hypothetical protein
LQGDAPRTVEKRRKANVIVSTIGVEWRRRPHLVSAVGGGGFRDLGGLTVCAQPMCKLRQHQPNSG